MGARLRNEKYLKRNRSRYFGKFDLGRSYGCGSRSDLGSLNTKIAVIVEKVTRLESLEERVERLERGKR